MLRSLLTFCFWLAGMVSVPAAAHAQGGNVFGPTVRAGDRTAEWRVLAVIGSDGGWTRATRLHYQHAFNDALRLRGVVQAVAESGESWDADFARAELLWQYREQTPSGYQAACRFDARLNAQGAHRFAANWVQQWDFSEDWRLRAILLADHEVGAGAGPGVRLSHRARLSRRFGERLNAGIETFGRFGNLADGLPSFDAQRHSAGPALFGDFNARWRWHATSQWALTRAADDTPLRVQIYRRF
jgi:hypothetical protein